MARRIAKVDGEQTPADTTTPAAGDTPPPPPESPTIDPRVAELEASLAAAHESYEREIAALRAEAAAANATAAEVGAHASRLAAELAETRERFDGAWRRREEEFVSMKVIAAPEPPPAALPETAPVKGRVLVATCLIRAHTRSGEKVTIIANSPIPDDVDVNTLGAGTYAEKGA